MVQRSGDTLIVRSVVSGDQLYLDLESGAKDYSNNSKRQSSSDRLNSAIVDVASDEAPPVNYSDANVTLPQCKIKRNYSCNTCTYFTQNPRHFLTHLKVEHGEKIVINACKHCLYASRHYQKLVRHMKMVHGSTDGLEEQALSRKRASQLARELKKRKNTLEDLQHQQTQHQQMQQVQQQHQQQKQNELQQQQQQLQIQQQLLQQQQQQSEQYPTPHPVALSEYYSDETPSPEFPNTKLLKCTICEYSTLHREQLTAHERQDHVKTKFFRCEKCSYVTHIKARFSKHVKYHSMPMIKCIMCDFRTPYKWNLDRHMKNHGGTGLYKCSACNFTADIKQSLTVHEMNHHVPPVGHASGMSMARRKNKVGGTDIIEQSYSPMNLSDSNRSSVCGGATDYSMSNNNNNNNNNFDSFNEPMLKKIKLEVPSDLAQKASSSPKRPSRPVPNLIPIQGLASPAPSVVQSPLLLPKTSALSVATNSVPGHQEFFNTFAQAMANPDNQTLRDFAQFMRQQAEQTVQQRPASAVPSQLSPTSNTSSSESSRRKNGNFFDKFIAGNRVEGTNLTCTCGRQSKCLSEMIIHQKQCQLHRELSPVNLSITNSGSTRCQHCRHRCKSSADLFIHMQHCMEAPHSASNGDSNESHSNYGSADKIDISEDYIDEIGDDDSDSEPHPMENRVFVWNRRPQPNIENSSCKIRGGSDASSTATKQDDDHDDSETNEESYKHDDVSYYGVETAPGYGEVTKKLNGDDEIVSPPLKKVFKCPHCSFWASTASRFHVHIVGHLNKKPFECSLCSYRSNWRWDITKHIRLKTIRDPSHKSARVLMNDETGRRNYTKYNKHITLMKVTEEDGDPKLLKSGEMTPSQEAALSFLSAGSVDGNRSKFNDGYESGSSGERPESGPLSLIKKNPSSKDCDFLPDTKHTLITVMPALLPTTQTQTDGADTKKTSFKCKKCNFR